MKENKQLNKVLLHLKSPVFRMIVKNRIKKLDKNFEKDFFYPYKRKSNRNFIVTDRNGYRTYTQRNEVVRNDLHAPVIG